MISFFASLRMTTVTRSPIAIQSAAGEGELYFHGSRVPFGHVALVTISAVFDACCHFIEFNNGDRLWNVFYWVPEA